MGFASLLLSVILLPSGTEGIDQRSQGATHRAALPNHEQLPGDASVGQPPITAASHSVVFAARNDFPETDVDACPMEGFLPSQYDEILGLGAKGYTSVSLCAVGYRVPSDPAAARPKVRFPMKRLIERV